MELYQRQHIYTGLTTKTLIHMKKMHWYMYMFPRKQVPMPTRFGESELESWVAFCLERHCEWVIKFNRFFSDSGVHVIHINQVVITYTLVRQCELAFKDSLPKPSNHVVNVKASSLWKPAHFLVQWAPANRGLAILWTNASLSLIGALKTRPVHGPYDTACWWASFYARS